LQEELAQAKRDAQVSAELDVRCQTLTATIAAQAKEIDQLRKQVSQQQQQIHQQQQIIDSPPPNSNGMSDLTSLKARLGKLEDELEDEKATHKRLMLHKNREYRELTEELEHERAMCQELKKEVTSLKKGSRPERVQRSPSMSRFDPTAYLAHPIYK
jgi:predicted RNase H-like nuclease (RuvC/YqgF family)